MTDAPSHALARPAVGKVLDALGLAADLAALIDPSGTSAVAAATVPVARALISQLEDRAEDRKAERMRLLLEDLRKRVGRLEKTDDPPVDLFREMLQRAIEDDDVRKIPAQGAVIEWVAEKRPDPALARMAMEAVATLTYQELRSFVTYHQRQGGRLKLARGFHENSTLARLLNLGIITQTSQSRGFVTPLGDAIAERCPEFAYSESEWERLS